MARKKRTSAAMDKAQKRATALGSIDKALDLGSGLTLPAYNVEIGKLSTKLDAYNKWLSQGDTMLNDIATSEKALNTLSVRMLGGVKVKYGPDSNEYEQAGGVRDSESKRGRRTSAKQSPTP